MFWFLYKSRDFSSLHFHEVKLFSSYLDITLLSIIDLNTYVFLVISTASAKYLFFGKCFKKLLNIFSNFCFFYLKAHCFRLIMENNFIQMAAPAGHAKAYAIDPIFKHIIVCVQLYFTTGFTNIVL